MSYSMKVAICLMIKNENRYIREWLEYHKKIGFDNVILYDNNHTNGENVYDVIRDDINSGYAIYENVKDKDRHLIYCYNECIQKYHNIFEWILFIDCDEFLELKGFNSIQKYLSQKKFINCEQILINTEEYDDNGMVHDDGRCVCERFNNKKEKKFISGLFHTKTLLNVGKYNANFTFKGTKHYIELYNTTYNVNGEKIFPSSLLFNKDDDCIIRHYRTKTIEEYLYRHKEDCIDETNMQLIAKKLEKFFIINDNTDNLAEKINIIKKQYPWYNYYGDKCSPIDIVVIDDGNPLLPYTVYSIKNNMPWHNSIFVVSENKIDIDGIILVKTETIVHSGFEKTDIGLYLHNIKELSERFIYVYSGTIFNYICFEDEFFNGNKVCMQPYNFKLIPNTERKTCYENNRLFINRKDVTCDKTFRVSKGNFGYMFSKTCCPMLKSDNKSCFDYFKSEINKKNKINHLIYPTWSRLMCHSFDYIHTNVSISECDDKLLEIEDPIYKIINIPTNCVDNELINKLKERYE